MTMDRTHYYLQRIMFKPDEGVQFRRIIHQKITKEVRVTKSYVSSLPSIIGQSNWDNRDGKSWKSDRHGGPRNSYEDAVEKSNKRPGFVRQLAKHFDVRDDQL